MSEDLIRCKVISVIGRRGTTGEVQIVKVREEKQNSVTSTISMYGSLEVGDTIVVRADRIKYLGT